MSASADAQRAMQQHFDACPENQPKRAHGTGGLCCATARELYANYLTARADELEIDPESFPGVRAWMREQGVEPKPMEEAMTKKR
jgi:spermidine synthase